jgi:hypothetical protein
MALALKFHLPVLALLFDHSSINYSTITRAFLPPTAHSSRSRNQKHGEALEYGIWEPGDILPGRIAFGSVWYGVVE